MKKIVFGFPIALGVNPALDVLVYGVQNALEEAGLSLSLAPYPNGISEPGTYPDFLMDAAIADGVDAVAYYVIDAEAGRESVARARAAGIAVFTITRPDFEVEASINHPGFTQGVFMMQYLLRLVPPGSAIGIIGGPGVVTDAEEVAGLTFALRRSGTHMLANDVEDPRYHNMHDSREGGVAPARALLDDYPDLAAIVPYNDETMLGVLDHFAEAGRGAGIAMVSRNGTPLAVDAVRAGRTSGTWDLDAPGIGRQLGQMIARHLSGEQPCCDHAAMAAAGRMIHRGNVGSWIPWMDRVRVAPLSTG